VTVSLEALRARDAISRLDDRFARRMSALAGEERPEVQVAAALASRRMLDGDVCVDLAALVSPGPLGEAQEADDGHVWPALDEWLEALSASPLVARADGPADTTPLVLDGRGRLYLRRFFEDEQRVARALRSRAETLASLPDPAAVRASIERLLPDDGSGDIQWPRVAAAVAVAKRLCVVTGGPGTGKTTTAARLLAVLVETALGRGGRAPRIELAAPTGKAAARLGEAIRGELARIDCAPAVRDAVPREAKTLHRLLGVDGRRLPGDAGTRRRGLRAGVVLVDEASMVDLALMATLVDALPEDARLVLLGDADQLASVEAGAVFADVCGPRRPPGYSRDAVAWIAAAAGQSPWEAQGRGSPVADCVVQLQRSHRYGEASGVGRLARAVRAGDAEAVLALCDDPGVPDVARLAAGAGAGTGAGTASLRDRIARGYEAFARAREPAARLLALDRFRVLCAVREGPRGVVALGQLAEETLLERGGLPARGRAPAESADGRPILVTRNAPHLGLYNGDVGVLAREGGVLRAHFASPEGALRKVAAARLPEHELVFAMSVHKSQGSEVDEVLLVLPDEDVPLLTRELVYTAVTRARERVVIQAGPEQLRAALARRVRRASGLGDALWDGAS